MPTKMDQQAAALSSEFAPFQVWVDLRPQDDGQPHWHARLSGWVGGHAINAFDAADMREKLIAWNREHPMTGGTL